MYLITRDNETFARFTNKYCNYTLLLFVLTGCQTVIAALHEKDESDSEDMVRKKLRFLIKTSCQKNLKKSPEIGQQ